MKKRRIFPVMSVRLEKKLEIFISYLINMRFSNNFEKPGGRDIIRIERARDIEAALFWGLHKQIHRNTYFLDLWERT